jgi:hypothetical protein
MDPVGLTTTIVNVVERLAHYAISVKGAKEDIRRISQELFALKGALEHLATWQPSAASLPPVTAMETDGDPPPSLHPVAGDPQQAVQMESMAQMTSETLEILSKKLGCTEPSDSNMNANETDGKKSAKKFKAVVQNLKWPFQKADVDHIVASLERAKTWYIMVITQDGADLTAGVFAEVRRLAEALREERESDADRAVLQRLSPANPDEDHERARKNRLPGTGLWFFDDTFEDWASGRSAEPILWVTGKSKSSKPRPSH